MSERITAQLQKTTARRFAPAQSGLLQRKCACGQHTIGGGECAACRQKREGTLQRRAMNQTESTSIPPIVYEVLRSPGQPLDPATRAFMEPRFAHDFSRVRVHTDARAAESAHAVNALAYTVGRDMVFGLGQYTPGTAAGKRLLAHEITHVVQQTHSAGRTGLGLTSQTAKRESGSGATLLSEDLWADTSFLRISDQTGESKAIAAETNGGILQAEGQNSPPELLLQRAVARPRIGERTSVDPARLEELRSLIEDYLEMRESGALPADTIAEVDRAVGRAEARIREANRVAGTEVSLATGAGVALGATVVLAADDLTVIGVADDIAIPFTLLAAGILALGALAASSFVRESNRAAAEAASDAISTIQGALTAAATALTVEEMIRTLESEGVKEEVRRLSPEGPGDFEFCFRIFARCLVQRGFEQRWIGLEIAEMPERMALAWEECMDNFLTCMSRGIRVVR